MRKIKLIIVLVLVFQASAINAQKGANNNEGITITPVILEEKIEMPVEAQKVLISKLNQILTKNGISGGANSRFVIMPSLSVLGKEVVSSAPVKIVYDVELSLSIGDGLTGDKFVSETISLKGIGTNETKAYISAVKNIKPKSPTFRSFVLEAKNEIVSYYNSNCDMILAAAKRQETLGNHYAAISGLVNIPKECSDCFEKSMPLLEIIYQKALVDDCAIKLNRAKGIWSANQDREAANSVGSILGSISPDANCYGDAELLYKDVAESVQASRNKAWDYIMLKNKQESEKIEAIRAIGVAYGANQPNPVYLISGW